MTMENDEEGEGNSKGSKGEKNTEGLSLLLEGLERESILGSEARFFVGAERNPLLPLSYFEWVPPPILGESRDRGRAARVGR